MSTTMACPICGGTGHIRVSSPVEVVVALRDGGPGSRREWAYLIASSGEVRSFRKDGKYLKREAGMGYYAISARDGDLIAQGYLSGSGKTYRLSVSRVSVLPDGSLRLDPVVEFDSPHSAEQYFRAMGINEEIW